jgi:hypothetical protein
VTEDLKQLAEIALETAREELTRKGSIVPTFLVREPDGHLGVIRIEADVMNSGDAKDTLFGAMRMMVKARGLTAVIFVSECWLGDQTAKGAALPYAEFLTRTRERAFATAVKDGLVERVEAITLTVQTPAGALIVHQRFTRDYGKQQVTFGVRDDLEYSVDEFAGRQKMYGDLRPENLG